MTKKHTKEFFLRGLAFGGFGPIIVGIVYLILSFTVENFSLSGVEAFTAIISIYLLAFVHAGASVFNQIDSWSIPKSLLAHFSLLYISYILCYVINSWIPFEPMVLLIFTAIFVVTYFIIWFTVYAIIKSTEKKLNKNLR